jgi:hypothetical protein
MIWAAITLAFFGFLRLGELTCNPKYNPNIHLSRDSIVFSPNLGVRSPQFMTVHIKEAKTDPFRLAHTITVYHYYFILSLILTFALCKP